MSVAKGILFFICALLVNHPATASSSSYAGKQHLVNGCQIFLINGIPLKRAPGDFCVFLSNGDFVSMSATTVRYFTKSGEIRWSRQDKMFHHQINLSPDQKRVMTMGSVEKVINGTTYLVDRFYVFNIETGEPIIQVDSDDIIRSAGLSPSVMKDTLILRSFSASEEYSHFNSFYEIGSLVARNKLHPAIRKGHYIINSVRLGFLVVDEKMEKVLFHKKLDQAFNHQVHDVQVTERGTIIAFVNVHTNKENIQYSSVIELDPVTMRVVAEIKSDPAAMFFSHFCGGVQDLGEGLVLFSHHYAGVFIYNQNIKKMIYSNYKIFLDGERIVPSQQIKLLNLDSFLKNNAETVF